ncbi:MAG: Rieske 2Fe-2S domain-containing protein [Myxococcota bacterium]
MTLFTPRTVARRSAAGPIDLPPFPKGWYAVGFSSELSSGQLRHGTYFGRELIIYRTEEGRPVVMDAYCPHLGAHMGHGGCVRGETVVCPFHHFAFDPEGTCVATPYGKRLPNATAATVPVIERNGILLAWHHPRGAAPEWEIPLLAPEAFGPLKTKTWPVLRSHPQETTENSVDLGHLTAVHGYDNVTVLRGLQTDGPRLHTKYAMSRRHFLPGMPPVDFEFEVQVYGLGYSYVTTHVPAHGLRGRHFVLPTPTDGHNIELRAALSIDLPEPGRLNPALALMPRAVARALVARIMIREYAGDIEQDFSIWEHKKYVNPPRLAEGDGPISRYRRWCRQFYPLSVVSTEASTTPSSPRRTAVP